MVGIVSPPQFTCWNPNPSTSDCDSIWRLGLQGGNWGKMKSLGHTLIQYDWCPYRKRRAGHRTQQAIVKTQSHLRSKEKVLQKKQTLSTPWSRTPSCQNCDEKVTVKPPSLWYFCYGDPTKCTSKWPACEWLEKEMKILKMSILLVSSAISQDISAVERMILTLCNFYYSGIILTLLCE